MAPVIQSIVAVFLIVNGIGFSLACEHYGVSPSLPGNSCQDIYHNNPASQGVSGEYYIKSGDDIRLQYCDMQLECGGKKGWMKLVNVNVASGNSCPNGWKNISSPVAACIARSQTAGCYSTTFSTEKIPYSSVCGMVVGYQQSSTDGFATFHYSTRSINGPYVDGVSITYGTPRKHIWTYAIGNNEKSNYLPQSPSNCPCSEFPGQLPPSFVHDNSYCESGRLLAGLAFSVSDPVWDGKDCSSGNSCCSEPSLPWFHRQIPLPTNEDIEIRICRDEASSNEDVLVEQIQLYVQ